MRATLEDFCDIFMFELDVLKQEREKRISIGGQFKSNYEIPTSSVLNTPYESEAY